MTEAARLPAKSGGVGADSDSETSNQERYSRGNSHAS